MKAKILSNKYLILLSIFFLISCERDKMIEDANSVPKIESIQVYRNFFLNQEFFFLRNTHILKEVNYNIDLSISDSTLYYYMKDSKVEQAIKYNIGLNDTDTIEYVYTHRVGSSANILKILGKVKHEIQYDEHYRISTSETIENGLVTRAYYSYDGNDNAISSNSVIDKISDVSFPVISIRKACSYEYNDVKNPFKQMGNAMINLNLLSENNIVIEKCLTTHVVHAAYEQVPEIIETEKITKYDYRYNNLGQPIQVKSYIVSHGDTVTYLINYRK